MLRIGTEDYYRRQREYNPTGKLAAGYVNMLDAILEIYYDRFDFFQYTNPEYGLAVRRFEALFARRR